MCSVGGLREPRREESGGNIRGVTAPTESGGVIEFAAELDGLREIGGRPGVWGRGEGRGWRLNAPTFREGFDKIGDVRNLLRGKGAEEGRHRGGGDAEADGAGEVWVGWQCIERCGFIKKNT